MPKHAEYLILLKNTKTGEYWSPDGLLYGFSSTDEAKKKAQEFNDGFILGDFEVETIRIPHPCSGS